MTTINTDERMRRIELRVAHRPEQVELHITMGDLNLYCQMTAGQAKALATALLSNLVPHTFYALGRLKPIILPTRRCRSSSGYVVFDASTVAPGAVVEAERD